MTLLLRKFYASALMMTASALAFLLVVGCSSDESGLGRRYKVTGKVTYKGEPVPHGTVTFVPTKPLPPEGRAASGELDNGYFSLSTAGNNDGALAGEYNVAVVALDIDLTSAKPKDGGVIIHTGSPEHKAALKAAKKLIPSKYGVSETSGLKATVKEGSNDINFDLTD